MFVDPLPREVLQETHEALAADPIVNIPASTLENNSTSKHLSPDHYKDTKPKLNASRPMAFQMPKEEFHAPSQEEGT
jgi:hypothetical protein